MLIIAIDKNRADTLLVYMFSFIITVDTVICMVQIADHDNGLFLFSY